MVAAERQYEGMETILAARNWEQLDAGRGTLTADTKQGILRGKGEEKGNRPGEKGNPLPVADSPDVANGERRPRSQGVPSTGR